MPSKKSKPLPSRAPGRTKTQASAWKEKPGCSEQELASLAQSLAKELRAGDRVLLEGAMGAGKSTFARFLLDSLQVTQPPEGSPSFAIAHEYDLPAKSSTRAQKVAHIDLYRIKSEDEIDEAGLTDLFWDNAFITLCEWASLWPAFEAVLRRPSSSAVVWSVRIAFSEGAATQRNVRIEKLRT